MGHFIFTIIHLVFISIYPGLLLFSVTAHLFLFHLKKEAKEKEEIREKREKEEKEKKEKEKHDILINEARKGNPESQYDYGRYVLNNFYPDEKETQEAIKWINVAAENGEHRALFELGIFLKNGKMGYQVDKEEAFKYLKKAYKLGNVEAKNVIDSLQREIDEDTKDEHERLSFGFSISDWRQVKHFISKCESDPERLFLKKIIRYSNLLPKKDKLVGKIVLEPQAEIGDFRVDFLVNERLVVEIDGKTYHSGDNSFEQDRLRDQKLIMNNMTPMRFPAKQIYSEIESVCSQVMQVATERYNYIEKNSSGSDDGNHNYDDRDNDIENDIFSDISNELLSLCSKIYKEIYTIDKNIIYPSEIGIFVGVVYSVILEMELSNDGKKMFLNHWFSSLSYRLQKNGSNINKKMLEDRYRGVEYYDFTFEISTGWCEGILTRTQNDFKKLISNVTDKDLPEYLNEEKYKYMYVTHENIIKSSIESFSYITNIINCPF